MISPVEKVRGARILPVRCSSEATKISEARAEGSWIVVAPMARLTIEDQFCCGITSSSACGPWACASTRPGMIVLPATSTTLAPAGIATCARGPMAAMRSPRTTTTPSSTIPPSLVARVTRRAPVSATMPVGLSAATSIDSETPAVGGLNLPASFGAPSAAGALG